MKLSRATIDDFFRENRSRGVDLDREMLWGFFFVDPRRDRLVHVGAQLVEAGYRYVDIHPPVDDDKNFHLHVERIEQHSSSSLYRRCSELDAFGKKARIADFDGFDVGNVNGSVLIPD